MMTSSELFVDALREWMEGVHRHSVRSLILYAKGSGLSMSMIGALLYILRRGVSDVSSVGDDLGLTSAAASQMLERLVQQELVLRSEDPHDRRVKQIVLTGKGRQVLEESLRLRTKWLEDLACTLSEEEKQQILAALEILIEKTNLLEKRPG
jgi:DNA-binding MarR family transcriptional regulator